MRAIRISNYAGGRAVDDRHLRLQRLHQRVVEIVGQHLEVGRVDACSAGVRFESHLHARRSALRRTFQFTFGRASTGALLVGRGLERAQSVRNPVCVIRGGCSR